MPKMKTHTGAKKRFKTTANGKIKRKQTNKRHILSSKSTKVKRRLRMPAMVAKSDAAAVKQMMPYG